MKNSFYFISFLILVIVLFAGIFVWNKISNYETTDNAYIRGSITNISSRIDGYVLDVPGVLNTKVKKGDILVKFDEAPFLSKVTTAKAELRASEAKIIELEATKSSEKLKIEEQLLKRSLAKTKVESAKSKKASEYSNLIMFEKEKKRIKKLLDTNNATKSDYEKTTANYEVSLHKVDQFDSDIQSTKIELKVIEKNIKKLEINLNKLEAEKSRYIANKESLEGQLETSQINLNSTNIRSPVDGIIANRIVEPGVYMKNGWPLMSVVPVDDVWVIANFKETQIKNIKIGSNVEIQIDAFSNFKIKGEVLSFSPASASSFSLIPPQNASGNFVKVVQRIPLKIIITLPDKLKGKVVPGMSVDVKVFN